MSDDGENKDGRAIDFAPDQERLRTALGAPEPWAIEIARLVQHVADIEFDASTFVPWLSSYRRQVESSVRRAVALEVANQPVTDVGTGEAVAGALQFRNLLSERLLLGDV